MSTNLDTMIRLIYMISILIIHVHKLYLYVENRLLVYGYNKHNDDRLIIHEAEHHMSWNTFTYENKQINSHYDK